MLEIFYVVSCNILCLLLTAIDTNVIYVMNSFFVSLYHAVSWVRVSISDLCVLTYFGCVLLRITIHILSL